MKASDVINFKQLLIEVRSQCPSSTSKWHSVYLKR